MQAVRLPPARNCPCEKKTHAPDRAHKHACLQQQVQGCAHQRHWARPGWAECPAERPGASEHRAETSAAASEGPAAAEGPRWQEAAPRREVVRPADDEAPGAAREGPRLPRRLHQQRVAHALAHPALRLLLQPPRLRRCLRALHLLAHQAPAGPGGHGLPPPLGCHGLLHRRVARRAPRQGQQDPPPQDVVLQRGVSEAAGGAAHGPQRRDCEARKDAEGDLRRQGGHRWQALAVKEGVEEQVLHLRLHGLRRHA
mmetsp:Transcript_109914/g.354901  ORF Transcript_109914/g.354901 Transcript_109914/m.354901 type:complete len:255 (+) Transcript_109914:105-869(+)